MPILSLENVTKDHDSDGQRVRALDGVTLAVEAGQFVTLVGRSGCGKSTLLNLAGGMDFALTGEVKIDGISTAGLADAPRKGGLHISVFSTAVHTFGF